VARTPQELQKEITRARTGAPKAITNGTEWTSPLGSVATGAPVGDQPVAFLYTGLSMLPVGAGGDFFAQAPEAAAQMARDLGGLDDAPAFARLFPAQDPSPEQAERLAQDLSSEPAALLWATPILASLACASVSALLGQSPRFCAGHSLGEIGMMVSHGYWRADTRWQDRLATDATLLTALSGPKTAVTAHLGVENADTWDSRLLMTDAARVAAALRNLPEALAGTVWISHCNTPSETIICGMGDAVDALATAVGADSVAGPLGPVIHCPPVGNAADGLKALLSALHVQTPADPPTLFFAADDMPFGPGDTRPVEGLSDVVVDGFGRKCDAPAMIERLYAAGARVFIELGPTTGFARWTKATLGDRPHLAVPSDRRGGVPGHGIAALTARLLAHNVPLDLERLHRLMGQDLSPLRAAAKLPVPIMVDPHPLGQAQIAPLQTVAPEPVVPIAQNPEPARMAAAAPSVGPRARIAQAHRAFLASRRRALAGSSAPLAPEIAPPVVLYDATAVRAFADGQLAQVLGREGAWIDNLPRRIRVPAPPFMALDRVMLIERPATGLAPARIVTEHDIPHDGGVDIDGQPPYLALDAQGILLLFSVMGYDRMLEGKRVYRWLDATLTYRGDPPRCGDTVRYDITVNRIVEDGSDLMVFADFKASVGDNKANRTVLEITNCAAGFFSDAALDGGQGLKPVTPQRRADSAAQPETPHRAPQRGRIDRAGLADLAAGNVAAVMGAQSAPGAAPNRLRLPPETMWMIDRVTGWDLGAGAPDLGVFEAEKDLDPSHWYLKAHFVDDPVFAGPCMIEGALQLLRIAALAHGLGAGTMDARFEPVADAALAVKFRSQVRGDRKSVFTYKLTVTGIGRDPVPWIVADVDLIHQGRITGRLSGLALQIVCGQDTIRWQPGTQGTLRAQTERTSLEHA
jgi:3-hydroxymyristoyl/3-hydroxydecanoyl-(acyl carrier protein) dehydratase/malonyl CoA-acyl carrier protein transacylase